MRLFRLAFIALPLALAGCGVPDLIAHGVKSYESSRPAQPSEASAQPAEASQPSPAAARPEPPPPAEVEAMPARTSVTVEPLK